MVRRWQGISSFITDRAKGPDQPQPSPAKGLYMYGGVGTGKTMLMDLLVHSAPPQFKVSPISHAAGANFEPHTMGLHQMLESTQHRLSQQKLCFLHPSAPWWMLRYPA